ncbi:MAG TPA: hypothetical protein VGG05_08885 [Pseudonocardiaceae bacterium]|jgi:hypothetical protein
MEAGPPGEPACPVNARPVCQMTTRPVCPATARRRFGVLGDSTAAGFGVPGDRTAAGFGLFGGCSTWRGSACW